MALANAPAIDGLNPEQTPLAAMLGQLSMCFIKQSIEIFGCVSTYCCVRVLSYITKLCQAAQPHRFRGQSHLPASQRQGRESRQGSGMLELLRALRAAGATAVLNGGDGSRPVGATCAAL